MTPEVAEVLRQHGWYESRRVDDTVTAEAVRLAEVRGHRPFPAAVEALAEFGGIYVAQDGQGRELRRRPFALDPTIAAGSADTLADFSRVIGAALFPLGIEGDHDALLAIDERGRVFALDHTGEWLLGDTVAGALETLVSGAAPPRVHDDGTT